jgi:hypothetical protein
MNKIQRSREKVKDFYRLVKRLQPLLVRDLLVLHG